MKSEEEEMKGEDEALRKRKEGARAKKSELLPSINHSISLAA